MQPDQLIGEIKKAGCLILPSSYEPWGVVIHEFAAAGLPLIASNEVGATKSFLIDGYNGFYFKSKDSNSLKSKMLKVMSFSSQKILEFSANSNELSSRINPKTSAKNLLSLIS